MSARVWKKPGTKAVRLFSLFGLLRTASKATAPGLCPSVRPSNADAADSRQIYGGRERERERERERDSGAKSGSANGLSGFSICSASAVREREEYIDRERERMAQMRPPERFAIWCPNAEGLTAAV